MKKIKKIMIQMAILSAGINNKYQKLHYTLLLIIILLLNSCNRTTTEKKNTDESVLTIERYSNGNIKLKGATINGLREGYWVLYNEDGTLSCEFVYIHDLLNGHT
jgi:antitoxin component YwqK of YwqJK toxin-antitoxin module